MKIVRDYSEQYEAILNQQMKRPRIAEDQQRIELYKELIDVTLSEYVLLPDLSFKNEIEQSYFHFFDDIARLHGGCLEMKIDEERGMTTVVLTGEVFVLDVDGDKNDLYNWVRILEKCESLSVTGKNDQFELTIFFQWKRMQKAHDYSEKIGRIRAQLREIKDEITIEECLS